MVEDGDENNSGDSSHEQNGYKPMSYPDNEDFSKYLDAGEMPEYIFSVPRLPPEPNNKYCPSYWGGGSSSVPDYNLYLPGSSQESYTQSTNELDNTRDYAVSDGRNIFNPSKRNRGYGYIDKATFKHYQPSYMFIEGLGAAASFTVYGDYSISQKENGLYELNINVSANSYGANNAGIVHFTGTVVVKLGGEKLWSQPLMKPNSDFLSTPDYIGSAIITLLPPKRTSDLTVHLIVDYSVRTTEAKGSPVFPYNRRLPIYIGR